MGAVTLDDKASAAAKAEGIARNYGHEVSWHERAYRIFVSWLESRRSGEEITMEGFRAWWDEADLGQPKHPNAWSGLASKIVAKKKGKEPLLIFHSYRNASSVSAHSRVIRTYRKNPARLFGDY